MFNGARKFERRCWGISVAVMAALSGAVFADDRDELTLAMRPPFRSAAPAEPEASEPATQPAPAEVPASEPAEQRVPVQPPTPQDFGPLGFAGRAGAPPAPAVGSDFYPLPDRWRVGIPGNYTQNTRGSLLNPYTQSVLKGDYPILGSDKFLILTLTSDTLLEARRTPTPSGVSTLRPERFDFFGRGSSEFINENFILSVDFFKGDAAYQPRDFDMKLTLVTNGNYVHASELGVISPDVRKGHDRTDDDVALQEGFVEKKLADLSPNFDFVSVRAGIQPFNNDFRGFLYLDEEPGVRLFGNYDNNRWQYNLAWFNQLEKDTNSGLNTFDFRNQNVFFANVFRQDFLIEGYTGQFSFAANIDHSGATHYDTNGFLARPAPIGTLVRKDVEAYYLGWAGDGHIGRLNITHQFYEVLGHESYNPIAGRGVDINAQFAAIEASYDRDYVRYRASFAYASGDHNPEDGKATGFDSIFDNPNFMGDGFSYFNREAIALTGTGVNLVNRDSFLPDLRTSKEQGQANFVNPGLVIYNIGADFNVTPKLKLITNASYLRFVDTKPLQLLLQDNHVGKDIGVDLSLGVQYRPLLNNNIIITGGAAALVPGAGFSNLYTSQTLFSTFVSVTLTF